MSGAGSVAAGAAAAAAEPRSSGEATARKRPREDGGCEEDGAAFAAAGGDSNEAAGASPLSSSLPLSSSSSSPSSSSSSSSCCSSSAALPSSSSSAPSSCALLAALCFRGPAADSRAGELLIDVLSIVASVGFAVEVNHCRFLCGATYRRGRRREDGSLDEAGYKGGTADMMAQSLRLQAPWAEAARKAGRNGWGGLPGTKTLLIRAAIGGDVARVRQLVLLGAPLDLVDAGGRSALHWACFMGHEAVAKALVDGKFEGGCEEIDLFSSYGLTPLMEASMNGHEGVVHLLLARGANLALYGYGRTALGLAKENGHAAIVTLLEAAGNAHVTRARADRP